MLAMAQVNMANVGSFQTLGQLDGIRSSFKRMERSVRPVYGPVVQATAMVAGTAVTILSAGTLAPLGVAIAGAGKTAAGQIAGHKARGRARAKKQAILAAAGIEAALYPISDELTFGVPAYPDPIPAPIPEQEIPLWAWGVVGAGGLLFLVAVI